MVRMLTFAAVAVILGTVTVAGVLLAARLGQPSSTEACTRVETMVNDMQDGAYDEREQLGRDLSGIRDAADSPEIEGAAGRGLRAYEARRAQLVRGEDPPAQLDEDIADAIIDLADTCRG